MIVILTHPVEIALQTLADEDRQSVTAWLERLENWENDGLVRKRSNQLSPGGNVYVLKTSTDMRIFFRLEQGKIVVLDIATRATILTVSGHVPEHGRR